MNKKNHLLYGSYLIIISLLSMLSLQIDTDLSLIAQWQLLNASHLPSQFNEVFFIQSQLPRLCITLLIGALLGLTGSIMQQLTQNNLTSPLTLGTSSGAWLALIILNIWFVDWVANYSALAAMFGALLAFGLIISITGIKNMLGLPIIVSGMVINILLGSIAAALTILNSQFAQNIFLWGAGNLTQYGWDWFLWLLPKTIIVPFVLLLAPRILTLLKLGQDGASARGLAVAPAFFLLMLASIWLVAISITAVGIISFIGLLTPNIARRLKARTSREELVASLLLGAMLLLATDILAILLSQWLSTTIPSGVAAATIGAPALFWFSIKKASFTNFIPQTEPLEKNRLTKRKIAIIFGLIISGIFIYVFSAYDGNNFHFSIPTSFQWQLRFPRLIAAISIGTALAIAGLILQRIIYNPLASPDILGVSSGATFAIILSGMLLTSVLSTFSWMIAFAGSFTVLAVLLLVGKRNQFNPSSLLLSGIAISALLESLVQFTLSQGLADSYKTLLWLAGSTYRITKTNAWLLFFAVVTLVCVVYALSRWITLLSIGRQFAKARGLNAINAVTLLLIIVALLCAFSTAMVGPVAFVGLIAPHMAKMLGAKKTNIQLTLAAMIGAILMLWADWLGQIVIYPNQIAVGTLVAIVGSVYFLCIRKSSN